MTNASGHKLVCARAVNVSTARTVQHNYQETSALQAYVSVWYSPENIC